MTHIIHTPSAIRDLRAITDRIAEHNLDAALEFYDEVDRIQPILRSGNLHG